MEQRFSEVVVCFKEKYMEQPVKRNCYNVTFSDVIKFCDLNSNDIDWYYFENSRI